MEGTGREGRGKTEERGKDAPANAYLSAPAVVTVSISLECFPEKQTFALKMVPENKKHLVIYSSTPGGGVSSPPLPSFSTEFEPSPLIDRDQKTNKKKAVSPTDRPQLLEATLVREAG